MGLSRALLVVCVVALIIVSCLVGLYVAGILRRRGIWPRRNGNVPGANTGYPGVSEPGWPQAAQYATGTPVVYSSCAAVPLATTRQYPAPNAYGAPQGYSGQPWTPQHQGYPTPQYAPGTVSKNVAPLYPV
ncbi:uncharacterized protein [Dermacentor albipictus]|uniref:uncharacterized protein n=1 Tax=Dermacentor albipictus TaxID=60249 RepID=UPI0038FCACC1